MLWQIVHYTTVFSIHVLTSFLHGYSATLAAKLIIKLELSWVELSFKSVAELFNRLTRLRHIADKRRDRTGCWWLLCTKRNTKSQCGWLVTGLRSHVTYYRSYRRRPSQSITWLMGCGPQIVVLLYDGPSLQAFMCPPNSPGASNPHNGWEINPHIWQGEAQFTLFGPNIEAWSYSLALCDLDTR